MSWLEVAAIAVALLGVGAAGFLVAQRPTFWWGLVAVVLQAGLKAAWPYLSARMSPEQEAAMQKCHRQGRVWDPIRKTCK